MAKTSMAGVRAVIQSSLAVAIRNRRHAVQRRGRRRPVTHDCVMPKACRPGQASGTMRSASRRHGWRAFARHDAYGLPAASLFATGMGSDASSLSPARRCGHRVGRHPLAQAHARCLSPAIRGRNQVRASMRSFSAQAAGIPLGRQIVHPCDPEGACRTVRLSMPPTTPLGTGDTKAASAVPAMMATARRSAACCWTPTIRTSRR